MARSLESGSPDRVLRALASGGIFQEQQARTFALNLPAAMLRQGPASLYDLGLWMTDPLHFRVYAEMLHSGRLRSSQRPESAIVSKQSQVISSRRYRRAVTRTS
jgi:hypothetical protein